MQNFIGETLASIFACEFMQAEITPSDYFEVETSHGTEIVPADVLGFGVGVEEMGDAFTEFCEGAISDPAQVCERQHGWLARLSARGYTDCTAWTAHKTPEAAASYLLAEYGGEHMFACVINPSSGEFLEAPRLLENVDDIDPLSYARAYAEVCGMTLDERDGDVPNCSGDFRIEVCEDPWNRSRIWSGRSFYFAAE